MTRAVPRKHQEALAAKILADRAKHGNPLVRCSTCTRAPSSPYRVYDARGKVARGCIDAIHGAHLVSGTESARHHWSGESHALRAAEWAMLEAL